MADSGYRGACAHMRNDVLIGLLGVALVITGTFLIGFGIGIHIAMWVVGIVATVVGLTLIAYFIYVLITYWKICNNCCGCVCPPI